MGSRLIPELLTRGHKVRALVRSGSEHKLPSSCTPIRGSALDGYTYANAIGPADTFVHLVGVPHPSPAKEFRLIDYVAACEAFDAAKCSGIQHFVYLSVAHPAPTMKAFIEIRVECEALLGKTGMNVTILRPWYVLGPGHRWPCVLIPGYALAELIPSMRDTARRLGLVTIDQMVRKLALTVEHPVDGKRVLGVLEIRLERRKVLTEEKNAPDSHR